MAVTSILAVAVASGRVGYVFFYNGTLYDWGITVKASRSTDDLVSYLQALINRLEPAVVVTERCDDSCRKGARTRKFIQSLSEIASRNMVQDISVSRPRNFPSKYEEAQALVYHYRELAGYVPAHKRRIFDFEPRAMVLFEAAALAHTVLSTNQEEKVATIS